MKHHCEVCKRLDAEIKRMEEMREKFKHDGCWVDDSFLANWTATRLLLLIEIRDGKKDVKDL